MIQILSEEPIFLEAGWRAATLARCGFPLPLRAKAWWRSNQQDLMENEFKTWMCLICGWIYDEAAGAPDEGIAAGTRWADVPMNWTCPECGARKEDFEMTEI